MDCEKLGFYQCIQLLERCVKQGVVHTDPKRQENILVCRSTGWYSEPLHDVAMELKNSAEGQKILSEAVNKKIKGE